jgi:drug/metabolite transporter (DMT)-like permease
VLIARPWEAVDAVDPTGVGLMLLGSASVGLSFVYAKRFLFLVEEIGAVTASGATYIPPVVALAIGWLAVGEPLTWWDGLAVLLILAGVVILRLGNRPTAPTRSGASDDEPKSVASRIGELGHRHRKAPSR